MKRIVKISIIAFAVSALLFCLVGCGESKEDKTEDAIEIDMSVVSSEIIENEAKAKQDYEGKTVIYTGQIDRVSSDTAYMYQDTYKGLPSSTVYVKLSNDELAGLEKRKTYTVCGTAKLSGFSLVIEDAFIVE